MPYPFDLGLISGGRCIYGLHNDNINFDIINNCLHKKITVSDTDDYFE